MAHVITGGQNVFLEFPRELPGENGLPDDVRCVDADAEPGLGLPTPGRGAGRRVYTGTLAVSVFVLLEELSQAFFPRRTLDALDLTADAAGIALFTWMSWRIQRRETRRWQVPAGR